jgi:hypothetical protein|tara:strand:+ start:4909 stop:5091 length:183 start_codon:yes stop_codon:yes gene_type:complete
MAPIQDGGTAMALSKRQKRANRRSRERVRVYLYGSDREKSSSGKASFAGGGCGGVACGAP